MEAPFIVMGDHESRRHFFERMTYEILGFLDGFIGEFYTSGMHRLIDAGLRRLLDNFALKALNCGELMFNPAYVGDPFGRVIDWVVRPDEDDPSVVIINFKLFEEGDRYREYYAREIRFSGWARAGARRLGEGEL